MSILWEWLHKAAPFTGPDADTGVAAGDTLTPALFTRLLDEEYAKLLAAGDRDVHAHSKATTLPISRAIVDAIVTRPLKAPWFIDLLNLTLETHDLGEAERRIADYMARFEADGTRLTHNLDF